MIISLVCLSFTCFLNIGRTKYKVMKMAEEENLGLSLILSILIGLIESGLSIEKGINEISKIEGIEYKEEFMEISKQIKNGTNIIYLKKLFIGELSFLFDTVSISLITGSSPNECLKNTIESFNNKRLTSEKVKAENLGVNILLPVGLCYLPAFILLGIVPIIVSMMENI